MNHHIDSWDTVLYAFSDGEVDLDSMLRFFEQTTTLAKDKGISKILFDGRFLSGDLSDVQRINLAVKATDHLRQIGTHPTIAVAGNPPTHNGLAALAMQSIGADVQLFSELREANDWLNKSLHLW